jgi:hypothetical protein
MGRNPATRADRHPFFIEHLVPKRVGGRVTSRMVWGEVKSLPTLEQAQEYVWVQLETTGGQWRVRRGHEVLVQGAGLTPAERDAPRQFWIDWAKRTAQTLGALLADTIDRAPSQDDTVFGCVNQLIDVEQQLSALTKESTS